MVQPLWKIVWSFLRKLEFSYDPAIPFLVIYPDKTIIWKDTCTSVFIAALFTITKTWKQSKCASTDEWIKVSYIHTIDYYSAIKKNEIMPCTACNAGVPGSIPGSGRPSGKEYSTHSSILGPPWWLRMNLPAVWEIWVQSLGWEDSLEEGMETYSSILAWRIPMDKGAWRATVHGVAKSWTQLSN